MQILEQRACSLSLLTCMSKLFSRAIFQRLDMSFSISPHLFLGHACEYFAFKPGINQYNSVNVFGCLLCNSKTFYPPSFSYQCIGLHVTAPLDRRYQSEMKALTAATLYASLGLPYLSVCREIRGLFSAPTGRASIPIHTGLRGASHQCGRFFLAQKVQGCVSATT